LSMNPAASAMSSSSVRVLHARREVTAAAPRTFAAAATNAYATAFMPPSAVCRPPSVPSEQLQGETFRGRGHGVDEIRRAGELFRLHAPLARRQLRALLEAAAEEQIEPAVALRVDPEVEHRREAELLVARVHRELHAAARGERHFQARDGLGHLREMQPLADVFAPGPEAAEREVH